MRQLPIPNVSSRDLFYQCAGSVNDSTQRKQYLTNYPHVEIAAAEFETASTTKSWCSLPRVPRGHPDTIVLGTLSKGQMVDLYSTYMVGPKVAARYWYDKIKVAANGKCPLCGGIGQVKTLDHYLPKGNFPQYSVYPTNLVPSCRDCNTGKGSNFPTAAEHQGINPYLDGAHFFQEKWITATVSNTTPVVVSFSASPPNAWSATDQSRAISHFKDYDLAKRFSIEATTELSCLLEMRSGILKDQSADEFRQYLMELSNTSALPINGWRRAMYSALANATWFHSAQF